MKVHVINEAPIERTPRVLQLSGLFDLPPEEKSRVELDMELPLEERDWNIGLIVGPSGSGKTSLAREVWGDSVVAGFDWPADKAVIDGFPDIGIKEVTSLLGAVGFNSPPAWLRPYRVLSGGEQFRATVARALAEPTDGPIVIDEWTSTVDRQVGKVASHTAQKAVRKAGRQLVAVTCHYDVEEWLQPDWVAVPGTASFVWRSVQPRPRVELVVAQIPRSAWTLFSRHHYLSAKLHPGAHCFGGWVGDELVGFTSYMHFPHAKVHDIKMGHRLVVLPDWQGLGIGGALDDWLGQHLWEQGYRYHNVVAHPAMVNYYRRSVRWRAVGHPSSLQTTSRNAGLRDRFQQTRRMSTWSFEYVAIPGTRKGRRAA